MHDHLASLERLADVLSLCGSWAELLVMFLAVTAFTFQRCLDPSSGQSFTISYCPVGQVISISSAVVGFNTRWDPSSAGSSCLWTDVKCETSTRRYPVIANCYGQRGCNFTSSVLRNVFRSCWVHRSWKENANFIRIEHQCINGIVLLCLRQFIHKT